MFPVIQLGPLALQAPGLILLIALWLGLNTAEKVAPRKGLPADALYNLVFISLITGMIAARLSFVASHINAFAENWLSVLALDPRLLDPWAGVGAVLIAALIIGQRNKLALWPTLDALTPFFAVLAIGLWFSALSAGTAFGRETSLPWGIQLWGVTRHPTQIYGLIGAAFIFVWVYRDQKQPDGKTFLHFTALTAATILFVEAFRADSMLIGNIRTLQAAAWLILAIAFYFIDQKSQATSD